MFLPGCSFCVWCSRLDDLSERIQTLWIIGPFNMCLELWLCFWKGPQNRSGKLGFGHHTSGEIYLESKKHIQTQLTIFKPIVAHVLIHMFWFLLQVPITTKGFGGWLESDSQVLVAETRPELRSKTVRKACQNCRENLPWRAPSSDLEGHRWKLFLQASRRC